MLNQKVLVPAFVSNKLNSSDFKVVVALVDLEPGTLYYKKHKHWYQPAKASYKPNRRRIDRMMIAENKAQRKARNIASEHETK